MKWIVTLSNIPEAPADGYVYGRDGQTTSWQAVVPLAGGVMTGALGVPNGTSSAPGLAIGTLDGTGIMRSGSAVVLGVQATANLALFSGGTSQFYGQLNMLSNKVTGLADATPRATRSTNAAAMRAMSAMLAAR